MAIKQPDNGDQKPLETANSAPRTGEKRQEPEDRALPQADLSRAVRHEDIFTQLPPHAQARAALGFTEANQTRLDIPKGTVLMAIQCRKSDHPQLMRALYGDKRSNTIFPLSTNSFLGSSDDAPDSVITTLHIAHSEANAENISRQLYSMDMPTRVLESRTAVVSKSGGNLLTFSEDFDALSLVNPIKLADDDKPVLDEARGHTIGDYRISERSTLRANHENEKEAKAGPVPPNKARCNYLIIDPAQFTALWPDRQASAKTITVLRQEIAGAASSPETWISQQNGMITITSIAERSGTMMRQIAKKLQDKFSGQFLIFYGAGRIQTREGGYEIAGYPTQEEINYTKNRYLTGTYGLASQAPKFNGSRDATRYQLQHEESDIDGIVRITDIESKIQHRTGGPSMRIGFENEYGRLLDSSDPLSDTQLIVLRGAAGVGKSTLLKELSEARGSTDATLDPGKMDTPGHQLADLLSQLADDLTEKLRAEAQRVLAENTDSESAENHNARIALTVCDNLDEYNQRTEEAKISLANQNPEEVKTRILAALVANEILFGAFLFTLDDCHHIDEGSDEHIMDVIKTFLETSTAGSKAVLGLRPEQRYTSAHQAALEKSLAAKGKARGLEAVQYVDLQALPFKQDLADQADPQQSLLYRYIYHSLPKDMHTTDSGETRVLGDWYQDLPERATTQHELNGLLELLDDEDGKFGGVVIDGEQINIKPAARKLIEEQASDGEISTINLTRFRRRTEDERTLLTAVAMIGREVDNHTLNTIMKSLWGELKTDVLESLHLGHLLIPSSAQAGEAPLTRKLQHDTLRDTILDNTTEEEIIGLALKLNEALGGDDSRSADMKFNLLNHAAASVPPAARGYWKDYLNSFRTSYEAATSQNQFGRARNLSKTLVGEVLPSETDAKTTVGRLIQLLRTGEARTNEEYKEFADSLTETSETVVTALVAAAEATYLKGDFEQTYQIVDAILEIYTNSGGIEPYTLSAACQTAFDAAYDSNNSDMMTRYQQFVVTELEAKTKQGKVRAFILDRKVQFRKAGQKAAKLQEVLDAITEGTSPSSELAPPHKPEYHRELAQLKRRIQFEIIYQASQKDRGIDEDVAMSPNHLTKAEIQSLLRMRGELKTSISFANQNPQQVNRLQKLHLLELQGQVEAMLGNYDGIEAEVPKTRRERTGLSGIWARITGGETAGLEEASSTPANTPGAISILAESWRVAVSLGMYSKAMRLGALLGKVLIMEATTTVQLHSTTSTPGQITQRRVFDRKGLTRAVSAYSDQVVGLSDEVEDPNFFYHVAGRIDQLRAMAIECTMIERDIDNSLGTSADEAVIQRAKERLDQLRPHFEEAVEFLDASNTPWGRDAAEKYTVMFGTFITPTLGYIANSIDKIDQLTGKTASTLDPSRTYAEGTDVEALTGLEDRDTPYLRKETFLMLADSIRERFPTVDDLGETRRKIDGIIAAAKFMESKLAATDESPSIRLQGKEKTEAETTWAGVIDSLEKAKQDWMRKRTITSQVEALRA